MIIVNVSITKEYLYTAYQIPSMKKVSNFALWKYNWVQYKTASRYNFDNFMVKSLRH